MQCGAGRRRQLETIARAEGGVAANAAPEPVHASKRRDTYDKWADTQDFARAAEDAAPVPTLEQLAARADAGDTPGVGHDWVVGGTLAGGVMQAEMMLTTRNLTAVAHFLPMLGRISNFMEGRRVQDSR